MHNGYLNSKFADNISAFNNKISSLSSDNISDKTEIKILKINKRVQEILGENMFGSLGASAVTSDGTINAKNLTVKSDNTGTINSIAVAGSENSESHGFADGFNDKVYKGETFINYADDSFKWMSTKLLDAFTIKDKKLDKSGEKKPTDAGIEAGEEAGNETSTDSEHGGAGSDVSVDNSVESQLNIAGAGSAGISDIKNDGTINISNSNVTTNNDFLSSSESKAHIVNVAGQSVLSSEFASGLTFAYNAMNNTTGINVKLGGRSKAIDDLSLLQRRKAQLVGSK